MLLWAQPNKEGELNYNAFVTRLMESEDQEEPSTPSHHSPLYMVVSSRAKNGWVQEILREAARASRHAR